LEPKTVFSRRETRALLSENRIGGLLHREGDDFADLRDVFGRMIADHGNAAETDVLQLEKRGPDPYARRKMGEQFARLITGCAEPDFSASRAFKFSYASMLARP